MLKAKSSSPISNIKWSFFKNPKFWAIVVFFIVLVALPVALYEVQQQQTNQQHASTQVWNSGYDTCKHIQVIRLLENPSCTSGTSKINSYNTTVSLKTIDGNTYTVHVNYESFWCMNKSELGDGVNPDSCIKRNNGFKKDYSVGGTNVDITSATQQPTSGYSYCGIYQDDFSFTYTDKSGSSCHFGYSALDPDPNHPVLAAGYCTTGINCSTVVNTPTPTPTKAPTATPTNEPTATPTIPIDTDTPTPTASPSATPTDTPAATPTVTPTGTLTPTVTPTNTPTGNPTATPVPPGSPTPTIIVVKPTLPPTGPSNTIMAVGLVGVAISVLGLALLIGI